MSITLNYPDVPYSAEQLIMALSYSSDDQIIHAYRELVVSLGGQTHVMDNLRPEARPVYLLALVVRAAA